MNKQTLYKHDRMVDVCFWPIEITEYRPYFLMLKVKWFLSRSKQYLADDIIFIDIDKVKEYIELLE